MDIKILPAMHGDCILISFGEGKNRKNILIDGGVSRTYRLYLKDELIKIKSKGEYIDLLIITHIDDDHIAGICRWFEDDEFDKSIIKKVWFNSKRNICRHFNSDVKEVENTVQLNVNLSNKKSVKQGIYLEDKLSELNTWVKEVIFEEYKDEIGECKIRVLSPDLKGLEKLNNKWEIEESKNTKKARAVDYKYLIEELILREDVEDKSVPNESSIAVLMEYRESNILLLGDAKASVVVKALNRIGYNESNKLNLNLLKVAHHGSKNNISEELLKSIECKNYVISTDSQMHGLPDKECLSKIIVSNREVNLYFNYNYILKKKVFTQEEYEKFNFKCNILREDESCYIEGGIYLWR